MGKTWQERVKERDNHECQLSKLFGIAELTGVPCGEDLDVHHRTYQRYGYEELEDGVTVCTRCHDLLTDMVRRVRYEAQRKNALSLLVEEQPNLPRREVIADGDTGTEGTLHGCCPIDLPQRADG